jgi:uncharacterized protein YdhG (YjbR/CyaY superfamily)
MPDAKKAPKTAAKPNADSGAWTAEERAAMQEHAREVKIASRRGAALDPAEGEREVLAKIAEMPGPERAMAERIHAIVMASAPHLVPRTFYGMPAYARNGKVVCFFQPGTKFKVRYSTLGFQQDARLDDGAMWPVAFALTELTPAVEARVAELVTRAAS